MSVFFSSFLFKAFFYAQRAHQQPNIHSNNLSSILAPRSTIVWKALQFQHQHSVPRVLASDYCRSYYTPGAFWSHYTILSCNCGYFAISYQHIEHNPTHQASQAPRDIFYYVHTTISVRHNTSEDVRSHIANNSTMSRRQPTQNPSNRSFGQRSKFDPNSSGSIRATTDAGPSSGNRAKVPAPSVPSPTSNRDYQAQLDKLQKMSLNQEQTTNATMTPHRVTAHHDRHISNMSTSTLNSVPESPAFSDRSGGVMTAFKFPKSHGGPKVEDSSQMIPASCPTIFKTRY